MTWVQVAKQYFQESPARLTTLLTFSIILIILATSLLPKSGEKAEPETSYLSDLIPEGYVLVPVQIINGDALSQMMDLTAYVDLYSLDIIKRRKQLLFKKIKIIKNPSDPISFSILLSENKGQELNFLEEPVFAVLKSRKSKTEEIKKTNKVQFQLYGEEI